MILPNIPCEDSSTFYNLTSSTNFSTFQTLILALLSKKSNSGTNAIDISFIISTLEMTTTSTLDKPRTVLGPLTTTFTPPAYCGYIVIPTTSWGGSRGYSGHSCKSDYTFGHVRAVVYPMVPSTLFCNIACFFLVLIYRLHDYTGRCDKVLAPNNGGGSIPNRSIWEMGFLLAWPCLPIWLHRRLYGYRQWRCAMACTICDG